MNHFCRIAAAILLSLSATATRAETLFDNGAPSLLEGNEMTFWREADSFTITEPVILNAVRFWEIQARASSFYGWFLWEIRANSATNTPGVLLATGTSESLSRVATGRAAFVIYPEFVNTFEVPAISLPPGTYWLVLHNGPLSNTATRDIFWETAVNTSVEPSLSQAAPFTGPWRGNGPASKNAFQLFGITDSFRPRITAIDRPEGVPRITFTTQSGQTYRLEYKNSIVNAEWAPVPGAESIPGTGSEVQVSDPDPASSGLSRRFYRVQMQLPPPPAPSTLRAIDSAPTPFDANRESNGQRENSLRSRAARNLGR
jgi:hypothetical protein